MMKRKSPFGISTVIIETDKFWIETLEIPHIDRYDGGHILITPKIKFSCRTDLPPHLAIELMKLSMITGEAMMDVLRSQGIDIVRINFQENGNWVLQRNDSYLHLHLYGRALSSKNQKHRHSLYLPLPDSGFYDKFDCLTKEDIQMIRQKIEELMLSNKYRKW